MMKMTQVFVLFYLVAFIKAAVPAPHVSHVSRPRLSSDISGNVHYRKLWRDVHASVREGRKLHDELDRSTLLPKSVNQMISAGEESGRLSDVLQEIAVYYSRVLRDAIKTMTSMIEPLLIVVMGSVVGFIAMAIILPIFKMSAIVGG